VRHHRPSWKRQRLAEDTELLREQARTLQRGPDLDQALRRIRQNQTAARMSEWLSSPGLKVPT
jgi:hypothetical protein